MSGLLKRSSKQALVSFLLHWCNYLFLGTLGIQLLFASSARLRAAFQADRKSWPLDNYLSTALSSATFFFKLCSDITINVQVSTYHRNKHKLVVKNKNVSLHCQDRGLLWKKKQNTFCWKEINILFFVKLKKVRNLIENKIWFGKI